MRINKRNLSCGCYLSWNGEDAVFALCIKHSIEYKTWKAIKKEIIEGQRQNGYESLIYEHDDDDDYIDEFVKMVTVRQKTELKSFDSELLVEMQ